MSTDIPNEVADFRQKWVLKTGDQIRCADHTYTIDGEPLGYGGSSVIYPAVRNDSNLKYALKECFPNMPDKFIRKNGVIIAVDEFGKKQLEQYIAMLNTEQEYGQNIRNISGRAINIWERLSVQRIITGGEVFHNAASAIITVMERMDEKGVFLSDLLKDIASKKETAPSLRTGCLPNIHTVVCIVEQILIALDAVHKAGYLFGDISPNNIFFTEYCSAVGNVGLGSLLDFGSVRPLLEDGLTAELKDLQVFSTKGYTPPEMESGSSGKRRFGRQADIYCVGRLMLLNLLTRGKDLTKISMTVNRLLLPAHGKEIGCSGKVLELTNRILCKALQYKPEERYKDAEEMLSAIRELKKFTQPPLYILPSNQSAPDYFVPHSRDEEIGALMKSVNAGETVFIWGVGGIGKTEVAIELAKKLNPVKGAYLIHFQKSMKETILKMCFSGYRYEPKKGLSLEEQEESEYLERLEILRNYYKDAVLIVDHFDCTDKTLDDLRQERAFQDFQGLEIKRIFTTRYPILRKEWEIGALSDPALLILMRHFCTDGSVTEEQLLDLIHEVKGHTLTLTLIAKTLEESWGDVTPAMILDALKSSKLSEMDYFKVVSDQNRTYSKMQIYEHLKTLFDLYSMNEADKTVLCCATLLPEDGMHAQLFRRCLQQEEQKSLQNLVKRGWINNTQQSLLMLHPVIREVCCGELKPSDDICTLFLEQLWSMYDDKNYDMVRYRQMASIFACAADLLEDKQGNFGFRAGQIYGKLGDYFLQKAYCQKALTKRIQALPYDHTGVAAAYNGLGDAYGNLDEHMQQLGCYFRALQIRRQRIVSGSDKCSGFLNGAHDNLDDYTQQFMFVTAAMKNQDIDALPYDSEIATFCSNIGRAYCQIGDYDRGFDYSVKAFQIRTQILPPNHLDLAISYIVTGDVYGKMGKEEQQLERYLKALEIRESILQPKHPDLALSYIKIGDVCGTLCREEQQLFYYQSAWEIYKGQLPVNHPDMGRLCFRIGEAYRKSEDEKQLDYYLKALTIFEQIFPEYHPNVVVLYERIAEACGYIGDCVGLLTYCSKHLDIQERVIHDRSRIANICKDMGWAYRRLADYEQALSYYQKALDIYTEDLYADHPLVADIYTQMAYTYKCWGKNAQARKYYLKTQKRYMPAVWRSAVDKLKWILRK